MNVMNPKSLHTVLEIVEDQFDDFTNRSDTSLAESLGRIHLHLHSLQAELLQAESEQDAEKLFQDFARLAAVAIAAAARHVLPAIQKGER